MLAETDAEMRAMAQEEIAALEPRETELEEEIKVLLLPKDPNDEKNVILEIRAGTGGDEASLFAAEIFRMYTRFAEQHKWKVEVMSMSESGVGGFKEVIAIIEGERVYSQMKWESGVHRVQRVPATETQGRVHTSAVTVAVLPEAAAAAPGRLAQVVQPRGHGRRTGATGPSGPSGPQGARQGMMAVSAQREPPGRLVLAVRLAWAW